MIRAGANRTLWEAMCTLPARDRQLLVDTDVHSVPDEVLADHYGCKPNALRQRRWRSRQAVRAMYANRTNRAR